MKNFFVLISFKPGYSGVFFCEKKYYEKNRNTPSYNADQKLRMFKKLSEDDEVHVHECICMGLTEEGHLAVMHTNVEDLGDVLKILELTKQRFLQQFTE